MIFTICPQVEFTGNFAAPLKCICDKVNPITLYTNDKSVDRVNKVKLIDFVS